LNYVIYSHSILPAEKAKYKDFNHDAPLYYFMPKLYPQKNIQGLLGGSFCANYEDTDNPLNQDHYKEILKRTVHFFGLDIRSEDKFLQGIKPKF